MTEKKKDELIELLNDGIEKVRNSDEFKSFLTAMSAFHAYSARNSMLIHLQSPSATRVAGYETWKKLNRQVRYGEKGITIFKPAITKLKVFEKDTNTGVTTEKVETELSFKPTTIFDISQTDGEPLPTYPIQDLTGNIENSQNLFTAIGKITDIPVNFCVFDGNKKGEFSRIESQINLKLGMSDEQTIKTYLHETAHAILHGSSAINISRATEELQAESTAFAVARHFNIDTSSYSFAYLASWAQTAQVSDIRQTLNSIQGAVHSMIDSIEQSLSELQKDNHTLLEAKKVTLLSEKLGAAQIKINKNLMKAEVAPYEKTAGQL